MSWISTRRAVGTAAVVLAVAAAASGCDMASGAVSPKKAAAAAAATSSASASGTAQPAGKPPEIVAFGGSASYGWGAGSYGYSIALGGHDGDSYPVQLAGLTGQTVANEGVVGELVTEPSDHEKVSGTVRFENYVAAHPGIGAIVVWEGLNDIGSGHSAAQIEGDFTQMIKAARASGVHLFLATLQPNDWRAGGPKELVREALNNWMRQDHGQYGVIDLEQVLKGGNDRSMNPLFVSTLNATHPHVGYPHLSAAGYGVVADAVAQAVNHPKQTAPQVTYPGAKS